MSKEKGILFKGDMVRAILEARKTQTRRVFPETKPCDHLAYIEASWRDEPTDWIIKENGRCYCRLCGNGVSAKNDFQGIRVPWKVGDILYVKETWGVGTRPDPFQGWIDGIEFRADEAYLGEHDDLDIYPCDDFDYEKHAGRGWRPSMFMPKAIARIWLKVTNIRVERLLDISEADALSEGVKFSTVPGDKPMYWDYIVESFYLSSAVKSYMTLWDKIAKRVGAHKENTWVFVIEFERIEKP